MDEGWGTHGLDRVRTTGIHLYVEKRENVFLDREERMLRREDEKSRLEFERLKLEEERLEKQASLKRKEQEREMELLKLRAETLRWAVSLSDQNCQSSKNRKMTWTLILNVLNNLSEARVGEKIRGQLV